MFNKFNGKKLLVLCGNVVHVKVVKASKQLGIYTIVTDSLPIEKSPAKMIADEALCLDVLDVQSIVDYCIKNQVDGVVNFCNDIAQRPYQQICEKLGFPCFGTEQQFYKLTDKCAFKKMCIDNNVDVIQQYAEKEIENGDVDYPVFVKPADSRGSRGQSVCNNYADLKTAILKAQTESSSGKVIVEKYMYGYPDFTATYFVVDGEPILIRTGDGYVGSEKDGLQKQAMCYVSPSFYTQMYMEHVNDSVCRCIKETGIVNGPIFLQGFVDGNTVRFYDQGLRFPGAEYEYFLADMFNVDFMKEIIYFALEGNFAVKKETLSDLYLLNNNFCAQLFISLGNGKISSIKGFQEIATHPGFVFMTQRKFVGDSIKASGDVNQRMCEIVLSRKDKAEIKSDIDWIYKTLSVEDEFGRDLIVSRIDVKRIV